MSTSTSSELPPVVVVVAGESMDVIVENKAIGVIEAAVITPRPVPAGYITHTESTTSILFALPTAPPPSNKNSKKNSTSTSTSSANATSNPTLLTPAVFLNPVQEYNRDLSIVAIRVWSEERQREKNEIWEEALRKRWAREKEKKRKTVTVGEGGGGEGGGKRRKVEDGAVEVEVTETVELTVEQIALEAAQAESRKHLSPPVCKVTILEALSATGLRAIRYAKEIPLLRYVVANDLSASAVEDIRRNVEWNDLLPSLPVVAPVVEPVTATAIEPEASTSKTLIKQIPKVDKQAAEDALLGKIRITEGDACTYMYNHRTESTRFDCVDLDPYGSAVPFLDAAIGAVADGGLLCITCTDLGVLAGHNYPEKAFSYYGGVCINAEYSHEIALRLVLHSISTTAAKYGRHIEPLLSLSIDFYVRLFIRVHTGPKEVKSLASKTSIVFYCHDCQSAEMTSMGRTNEKKSAKTGDINFTYHIPAATVGDKCRQCGGKLHIGGPVWSGPIHKPDFVGKMLEHIESNKSTIATHPRMLGMVSLAREELVDPLYFTPSRIASFFHATSPPLATVVSALLNGGYEVSRSHASAGSLKTSAPRTFVFDIIREWVKEGNGNEVVRTNVKEGSLADRLLAKAQTHEINLSNHSQALSIIRGTNKLVRYQQNPEPNWGPGKAATKGTPFIKSKARLENEKVAGAVGERSEVVEKER